MGPAAKKAALGVLVILAVVIIAAAIILHPYYAMPPESKEALKAKLAEYQQVASAMQNRPPAGRRALDALANDLYGKKSEKPWSDSCPAYDLERLKKLAPQMSTFLAFDARFRAMVDHGLVIQQEFRPDADLPNFSGPRWLTYWELAAAVLDLQQGHRDEALARMHSVIRFVESLLQTPALLYPMMGVAIEMTLDQTLVYLLPQLNPAEIEQVKGWLAGLPDARQAFVAAMKTETAAHEVTFERLRRPPPGDTFGDELIHNRTLSRTAVWLARNTGYLRRERYYLLSLMKREIEAAQSWAAAGGSQAFQDPLTRQDIMHSWIARMAIPNYAKLLVHTSDDMQRRQAIIKAMDLELQRRKNGPPTFELPYDSVQHIVVKPEYGCVVKNESAPGAAPAAH